MTALRSLAVGISSWVTWLASPGSREWAEGLEREVAFIESDWRALGWAIGSTRVLLERRGAPIASLAKAAAIAKDYRDSFGNRLKVTLPYSSLIMGASALWFFTGNHAYLDWMMRASGCLSAAALFCSGYCARVYRRRKVELPTDAYAWALYYRSELQKDLEYNSGTMGWLTVAFSDAAFCFLGASNLVPLHGEIPIPLVVLLTFSYGFAFAFGIFRRNASRRKLEWKIADLDALIARGA